MRLRTLRRPGSGALGELIEAGAERIVVLSAASRLLGQERWHRPGYPAEQQLAQARVRIGTHDQEVAAAIGGKDNSASPHRIHLAGLDRLNLRLDLMAGEMQADVRAP